MYTASRALARAQAMSEGWKRMSTSMRTKREAPPPSFHAPIFHLLSRRSHLHISWPTVKRVPSWQTVLLLSLSLSFSLFSFLAVGFPSSIRLVPFENRPTRVSSLCLFIRPNPRLCIRKEGKPRGVAKQSII